jgi:hypothetical protein
MIAVIFEAEPREDQQAAYLEARLLSYRLRVASVLR